MNQISAPVIGMSKVSRHHQKAVPRRRWGVRRIDAQATPTISSHTTTAAIQARSNANGRVGLLSLFTANPFRLEGQPSHWATVGYGFRRSHRDSSAVLVGVAVDRP